MGSFAAVYLAVTRERRTFPTFVKLQLLLIILEYFLSIGLQIWTNINEKQNYLDNESIR